MLEFAANIAQMAINSLNINQKRPQFLFLTFHPRLFNKKTGDLSKVACLMNI